MERYANGEDAAFGDLYDALAPRLFAYLQRQTRDRPQAEDLVQHTFMAMHRARGRFLRGAPVLPWAFAIARRLMIDAVRHGRRTPALVAEAECGAAGAGTARSAEPAADLVIEARELAARLEGALSSLPEAQRVAFELLKHDGLSLREAAAVLGTTVTAVKLRAHRAYEALRTVLGGELEGEPGGLA
ncbi:MAG TPA: RNA polymerase sigma factor [Myxococcota bacterium]|nr:RNA polymerase sigma factor [Myxococcota bacterium]